MKIIKKFWGVALVVILLSTLFVSAVPVSAGAYAFTDTALIPTGVLDNTLIGAAGAPLDVAQSGATIYMTTGAARLYKSTDGGATWAAANVALVGTPSIVAVAPDDANTVFYVNTAPALADEIYYSANGGVLFTALNYAARTTDVNSIAVSPLTGGVRYIVAGGHTVAVAEGSNGGVLDQFTLPAVVGAWTAQPGLTGAVSGLPAAAYEDFVGVAFSPNFVSDQAFFAVGLEYSNGVANGIVDLCYYNYNNDAWNPDTAGVATVLEDPAAGVAVTATKAEFAFDANFNQGDPAAQIGFIGIDITCVPNPGGVYTMAGTQMTITAAGTVAPATDSVAWDGTNLVTVDDAIANVAAGLVVRRSATALTSTLLSANVANKFPSTGFGGNVLFSNGAVLCFTQGNNGGIAKSTDNGKSFNGVKYLNTNFNTIRSAWFSPDASVKYLVTDDGVDINVWRQQSGVWERIMTLAGLFGQTWLVRADADNPANVWLGRQGAFKTLYKTTDAVTWTQRNSNQNIQDFAVQDANTIYVAVNGAALVTKTSNAGYTWTNPAIAMTWVGGGNAYSINLLADNQVLVGGTTGGVAYSADGATFTPAGTITLGGVLAAAAGNTIVTATGVAAGDTIYAAAVGDGVNNGEVASFTIGSGVALAMGQNLNVAAVNNLGIAISNGVLYVLDDVGNNLYRFRTSATAAATDIIATGALNHNVEINTLVAATEAGTASTIWALEDPGAVLMVSATDYLTSATTIPTLVSPIGGDIVQINSISGATATFLFKWSAPAVTGPLAGFGYDINLYLDEAGTLGFDNQVIGATPLPNVNCSSAVGWVVAGAAGLTGAAGTLMPGETYYWRVRVTANTPVQSAWTAMDSFTVQQLQAIVPVVSSPQNGSVVEPGNAGFSWNPIAGATSYKFELDTGVTFVAPLYSATVASAGAALPASINLERGRTYFWRVKVLTPAEGEWSTVANFTVAELPATTTATATTPATTIITAPTTTVTPTTVTSTVITIPAATSTVITMPPATTEVTEVNPTYIWAIIIIGAVLVIAVIVLIVRTRRSV